MNPQVFPCGFAFWLRVSIESESLCHPKYLEISLSKDGFLNEELSKMSTLAKLTFAGACVFTLSAMGYVHYKQIEDRHLLHQGIVRDMEARQKRKVENQYNLQTQIDITRRLNEHRLDEESQSES